MPATRCPVCRTSINPLRNLLRPGWARWRCKGCGSLIGVSLKHRLLALIPWLAILFAWMFAVVKLRWPLPYAIPIIVFLFFALYLLLDKIIVYERCGFRCRDCGYDLRGQLEPVCPECGRAFDEDEIRRMELARPDQTVVRERRISPLMRRTAILTVGLLLAGLLLHGLSLYWRSSRRATISDVQSVVDTLLVYAHDHGKLPPHAVACAGRDYLGPSVFLAWETETSPDSIPVAGVPLRRFQAASSLRQTELINAAIEALPDNLIAHRLGDFVFTYHGIDLSAADPGLWLVILSPEPLQNPEPARRVCVGCADGRVTQLDRPDFLGALARQNDLRAAHALPPLPHPATVAHDRPATAPEPDESPDAP